MLQAPFEVDSATACQVAGLVLASLTLLAQLRRQCCTNHLKVEEPPELRGTLPRPSPSNSCRLSAFPLPRVPMLAGPKGVDPIRVGLAGLLVAIKGGLAPVHCDSNAADDESSGVGVQVNLLMADMEDSDPPAAASAVSEVTELVPVVPAPMPVPIPAGAVPYMLNEAHPLELPPGPPRLRRPGNRVRVPWTLTQQQLEAPTPPKLRRPQRT